MDLGSDRPSIDFVRFALKLMPMGLAHPTMSVHSNAEWNHGDLSSARAPEEALNKLIPFMPFDRLRRAFDKPVLSPSTRLRTGLSKDLIRASLSYLNLLSWFRCRPSGRASFQGDGSMIDVSPIAEDSAAAPDDRFHCSVHGCEWRPHA
jgi:hypothetical protein